MATAILQELTSEFTSAVLAACPPAQWAGSVALCALLEREDSPQPGDPGETEAKLRARLEQHPTDLETLCAIDRLHGYRDSLIKVLLQRYDLAIDCDEQWRLLVRLGMLHLAAGFVEGMRSVIDALALLRVRAGAS